MYVRVIAVACVDRYAPNHTPPLTAEAAAEGLIPRTRGRGLHADRVVLKHSNSQQLTKDRRGQETTVI